MEANQRAPESLSAYAAARRQLTTLLAITDKSHTRWPSRSRPRSLEHIVVEARARHWTSKVHEYQGKLVALSAAEARGAPNKAELV